MATDVKYLRMLSTENFTGINIIYGYVCTKGVGINKEIR